MVKINEKKQIGFFLKRNDIDNLSGTDLCRELGYNLFEASIIMLAIERFKSRAMYSFDCAVGDWKCQTRTSIIVDLLKDKFFLEEELPLELLKIKKLFLETQEFYKKINSLTVIESQALKKEFKEMTLRSYLKEKQLNYEPTKNIEALSLCFLVTPSNNLLSVFNEYGISVNKMKALINIAKKTLCNLSIHYEQNLSKKYSMLNNQKLLTQIECKDSVCMAALFPGFKAVFKKMLIKKQPFVLDYRYFCSCGGIVKNQLQFFTPIKDEFIVTSILPDADEIITVINAYQFPGSLDQLQKILGVSSQDLGVPNKYYRECICTQPTDQQTFDSFQEAVMAFFAQHPQFTNGKEIDWQGLGLLDSDLKKEYDYLLTLKGYSRNDMSKFQIIHMYPSTVQHLLDEQKKILDHLGKK